MTASVCASCRAPVTDDAYLCDHRVREDTPACTERLELALGDVNALTQAAAITYTGQARITRRPSGLTEPDPDENLEQTAKIQPLPYDEGASKAVRRLRDCLVGWVRVVVEERRLYPDRLPGPACVLCTHTSCRATRSPGWPADTLPAMAAWLLGQVHWLRRHPDAAGALTEITRAVDGVARAVDRAPELLYAGPCVADVEHDGTKRRCWADMYVAADETDVTCPACRAPYSVATQRAYMLEASKDYLLSAIEISRAVQALQEKVGDDRIRTWVQRGQLAIRGRNAAGAPTYRLGDVTDLLDKAQAKREQAQREGGRMSA